MKVLQHLKVVRTKYFVFCKLLFLIWLFYGIFQPKPLFRYEVVVRWISSLSDDGRLGFKLWISGCGVINKSTYCASYSQSVSCCKMSAPGHTFMPPSKHVHFQSLKFKFNLFSSTLWRKWLFKIFHLLWAKFGLILWPNWELLSHGQVTAARVLWCPKLQPKLQLP